MKDISIPLVDVISATQSDVIEYNMVSESRKFTRCTGNYIIGIKYNNDIYEVSADVLCFETRYSASETMSGDYSWNIHSTNMAVQSILMSSDTTNVVNTLKRSDRIDIDVQSRLSNGDLLCRDRYYNASIVDIVKQDEVDNTTNYIINFRV